MKNDTLKKRDSELMALGIAIICALAIASCLISVLIYVMSHSKAIDEAEVATSPTYYTATNVVEYGGFLQCLDADTIPEWLDLHEQEWAETPYPGDEAYIQPSAEILRQVAQQAETTDLESFTALSADGHPWLSYDQETRRIVVNPHAYDVGPDDGPRNYLVEDPFVYEVGQPTLPNWEGVRPDWKWKNLVLTSFEEGRDEWSEVMGNVRVAWTDGLRHRVFVKVIRCGHHGVYPVMFLDSGRVVSYAVWPDGADTWWGTPVSRNGQVFEAISTDGQVLTWDLSKHLSFGKDLVDITVEQPWLDWTPTGQWTERPIEGKWFAPHCVSWSDEDNRLMVTLGTGEQPVESQEECEYATEARNNNWVTIYYGGQFVDFVSAHSWRIGRIFQGPCGCVLAVTDVGTWRITCDRFHASSHHHVFDVGWHVFPDCPGPDANARYEFADYGVTLTAFWEPNIYLVAISGDGNDTVVEIDGTRYLVRSPSWVDDRADTGWQPVDPARLTAADKIAFEEGYLVLQIGGEEERISLR